MGWWSLRCQGAQNSGCARLLATRPPGLFVCSGAVLRAEGYTVGLLGV